MDNEVSVMAFIDEKQMTTSWNSTDIYYFVNILILYQKWYEQPDCLV